MLVITAVCMTTIVSCGGGDGSTDGDLCSQCGDSDGPCIPEVEVSGGDRPDFCGTTDPCTVELRCLRKLDSGQRRCFPADPVTNALDVDYRCDGSRPNPSVAPTTTATASPTFTPSPSVTPSATAVTPTATTSPDPVPTSTATDDTADLTITIDDDSLEFTNSFSATVSYPAAKGTFKADGELDCSTGDDGLTVTDNGSGTLTLRFTGDSDGLFPVDTDCVFHLKAGETLDAGDVSGSVTPNPPLSIALDVAS